MAGLLDPHPIDRAYKRGKVLPLFEAGHLVFPFLGPLMSGQDFIQGVNSVRLCIDVSDPDVDDALRSLPPKAAYSNVASLG